MSKEIRHSYQFGPFRIDTVNRQLLRDGEVVPLKAKAVDTLLLLIRHRGDVVEKDELMEQLWPDSFVDEANLTQNIYMLRKALGNDPYIETVPRRGYRFAAEVKDWADTATDLVVIKERTRTSISYEEQSGDLEGRDSEPPNRQSVMAVIDLAHEPVALQQTGVESRRKGSRALRVLLLTLIVVVIVAGVVVFRRSPRRPPFEKVQLTRFTTTGKAEKAAISPDGKYLAHVLTDSGRMSVWLRQVATGKDLQIIAPTVADFYGLTFSHDGNYIYYVAQEMNHLGMLYQVPSLGGTSTKLAEDVDSAVTVSPDDKRLAFIRASPSARSIIVVNVDGTGERKLTSTNTAAAEFKIEPTYLIPPAWSPDGSTIACPVGLTSSVEDEYQTIWGFQADTGAGRALTTQHWQTLGRMEWVEAGNGIVVTAAEKGGNFTQQIWYVGYPDGVARKLTNDLNDYRDLSLTADAKTIVAVQSERRANIWITPATDLNQSRQVSSTNYDGLDGLCWTSTGRLVFTQQTAGEQNLWLTDLDGSNAAQLTRHAGFNLEPVASGDGRYIVFVSTRSGRLHLWRIDVDGKHALELTHGQEDRRPSITPDSKWIVFRSTVLGVGSRIFRIAIDGGEPVMLTETISGEPTVSPDGNSFVFFYRAAPAAINQIAVMPVMGGEPKLIRDLPSHYDRFHWTPDGQALAYSAKQEGAGNLWMQPLDGSAPKQLTHWSGNPTIFSFDWSPDGKWLAYSTGSMTSDVVLITDLAR